jgi:hypothetical protein
MRPLYLAIAFITLHLTAQQTPPTTAWKSGHFVVNAAGLVSRSDIVLAHPNTLPEEAIPMGNGRLGIAIWSAQGFTAQLNRGDTLPHRDSPGQLILPGLTALTRANNFHGRLDLYNGTMIEHGNGLTLTAWVQTSTPSSSTSPAPTPTPANPRNYASGRRATRKPQPPAKSPLSQKPGPTTTAPGRPESHSARSPPSPQPAVKSRPPSPVPDPSL